MKLAAALLVAAGLGCSGNAAPNPLGAGGTGGGGAGSGGTGPDPSFVAVAPCTSEASYWDDVSSVIFGNVVAGNTYNPACLKKPVGSTVFFSGEFSSHPLAPSTARGTLTGNPIRLTTSGANAGFTFDQPGFWAYTCTSHGSDPDGQGMAGVVWIK